MTKTKNAPPHPGAAHRGTASPASATVGTITMRVGGKYRLRNNAEVECVRRQAYGTPVGMVAIGFPTHFYIGPRGSGLTWNENGRYCATAVETDFDVVAEIESDGGYMGR